MRTVFILYLLVTLLCVVLCCEEETQYTKDGKCCKKCGPGMRMMMSDNCEDPLCKECDIGEYQSGYTVETKCQRQPSCDPNLHFKQEKNPSKTSRITCLCESGYYCTKEDDCSVCMKHTICIAGQKVVKQGSPFSDTVCNACENGTFSTRDSVNSCEKWTECMYAIDQPGTPTSDRTCVGAPIFRNVIVVVVVLLLALIIIVIAGVIFKNKGKYGCYQFQKPPFTEINGKEEVAIVVEPIIQQPEEEDEDEVGPVSPTPSNRTENGNVVQQEHGKEAFYPSRESNSHEHSVL